MSTGKIRVKCNSYQSQYESLYVNVNLKLVQYVCNWRNKARWLINISWVKGWGICLIILFIYYYYKLKTNITKSTYRLANISPYVVSMERFYVLLYFYPFNTNPIKSIVHVIEFNNKKRVQYNTYSRTFSTNQWIKQYWN